MQLTRSEKDQLVECLEACHSMRDPQQRVLLINRLPDDIRARVPHANSLRSAASSLIETCARFPAGLSSLQTALRWLEGESLSMAAFERCLAAAHAAEQPEPSSAPAPSELAPNALAPPHSDAPPRPGPCRLFYSYCHADEARRDRLETHLKLLQRQGRIASWHDRRITPGSDWSQAIDQHLEAADIILLLVSADFLASDYCWSVETKRALERHHAGSARVIPIILRSCDWHQATFGRLQALPGDGKPVSQWDDEDDAWTEIARALRELIDVRR
ncbi:MAG: hypothetical protein Tsb0020_11400 [Haliangiales bacterium]